MQRAGARGALAIAPAVYAELVAAPGYNVRAVDTFLSQAGIAVDWQLDEAVWRTAALAHGGYAERRRSQRGDRGPKRLLADFTIGAHAVTLAAALLTFDQRIFRPAVPSLTILDPNLSAAQ